MLIIFAFALLAVGVNAKCPNWCNKRGICTDPQEGGYCYCDWGFGGDDCSQRLCPAAFDPLGLSNITSRRTVRIETGNLGGVMMGKLEFTFGGSSVFLNADAADLDSAGCTSSLRGLKSTTDIECIRESFNPESKVGSYLIALKSFPLMPYMNNIILHNGNPSLNLFDCNIKKVDMEEAIGPYCRVSDVIVDDIPIYSQCANHGVCNPIGGKCDCQIGFKGIACEDMSDSTDINSTTHNGPFFTATLHKLNVIRTESSDFNIFQAQVSGENVTTIRGDRLMEHTGKVKVKGPLAVGYDGDVMRSTSMISTTISYSSLNNTPYHIQSFSPTLSSSSTVFSVSQEGNLLTLGTLSAANNTFTVDDMGSLSTTSLHLKDYLDVQGHANIAQSLSIGTGFIMGTSGMTIDVTRPTGSLLELKSRSENFNGSLLELHSASYDETAVLLKTVVRGKSTFEITAGGKMSLSGLKLHSGGIDILAGGLSIGAGGLVVNGGMTIATGGLHLLGEREGGGSGGGGGVFTAPAFHAELNTHMLDQPLLSAIIPSDTSVGGGGGKTYLYVGHALSLQGPNTSHYDLIHTKIASKTVFSLSGEGHIYASEKSTLHDITVPSRLSIGGDLHLKMTYITPTVVKGGSEFEVVVTAHMVYVTILPLPSMATSLVITLQSDKSSEHELSGRVLIITNTAHLTTTGIASIPANSTIMLLHNGQSFIDLHTLHAPIEHLHNVHTLTAKNDLNIGNFTFTAGNLQLSRIPKSRLLFTTRDGRLSSVDKLTFDKGVLTTPAIKLDRLVSNLDCKGNELSNAYLTKPKLTNADLTVEKMSFPGHTGIAYFDTQSNLKTSAGLGIDPESGSLILSTLTGNVDGQLHTLSNIQLEMCNISRAQNVQILGSLRLQNLNSQNNNRGTLGLLGVSSDGFVSSLDANLLSVKNEGKLVEISIAKISTLSSDVIDVKKANIKSLVANGGQLLDFDRIETDKLTVKGLSEEKSGVISSSSGRRLVFVDHNGQLQSSSSSASDQSQEEAVFIPRLRVKHLLSDNTDNTLDMQHQILKNVQLDPTSVLYAGNGMIPTLSANSFYLQKPLKNEGPASHYALLGHHVQTGQVIPLTGMAVYDSTVSTLDLTAVSLTKVSKLSTTSLHLLPSPATAEGEVRIVGIDKNGLIITPSDTITMSTAKLTINHDLTLASTAKITLLSAAVTTSSAKAKEEEPRLLGVDSQGVIIVINNKKSEEKQQEKEQPKDATFNRLTARSLTIDGRITLKETLSIGEAGLSFPHGIDEATKTGETIKSVLLFDENSKMMKKSSLLSFDVKNDQLLLSPTVTIKANNKGKITIMQPQLEGGESVGMTITDAPSITTRDLTVLQVAELRNDVIIGGSVTVRGSVVGAGPYIDSSDRRLKTNVKAAFWNSRNVSNSSSKRVLDVIDRLPLAVEYELKADENSQDAKQKQLGYIAQDLQALLPLAVYPLTSQANADRVVDEDPEPLLGVAYSRLSVVALEGIKALRQEHAQEVQELKTRIAKLEEHLAMVLQLVQLQQINTDKNKEKK